VTVRLEKISSIPILESCKMIEVDYYREIFLEVDQVNWITGLNFSIRTAFCQFGQIIC